MIYKSNTKQRVRTDFIAIHCSATNPKATKVDAAEIDRWHRKNGWACIGYHFVIKRDGVVETGRDETVIGAHVEGHNAYSIGICMVGGVDEKGQPQDNFTPAQYESLKELLRGLKELYPKAVIQGHRDFPGVKKACPSFSVKDWLQKEGLA